MGSVPPQLFFLKVNTDLYKMLKKKYQATVWEVFKKGTADKSTFASKATQTV